MSNEPTRAEIEEWKQHYQTPVALFRWIEAVMLPRFGHTRFTLDACATPWNSKCPEFIGPPGTMPCEGLVGVDGLTTSWRTSGAVWCNAGFGKLPPWFAQAKAQAEGGQFSVLVSHALGGEAWLSDFKTDGPALASILEPRVDYDEDPRYAAHMARMGQSPPGNMRNSMLWFFVPGHRGRCAVEFALPWPKEEKSKRKGKAAA